MTAWSNSSLGDWYISSNWSNGVPDPNTSAFIANGGTALITVAGTNLDGVADLHIGEDGGNGTLQLSGAGVLRYSVLYIGQGSPNTGTLNISNGAKVVQANLILNALTLIGFDFQTNGNVTVRDPGSEFDNINLIIGNAGTASLTMSNGGNVYSLMSIIGKLAGSSGTVTVTGNGSAWKDNGKGLFVGGSDNNGGGAASLSILSSGLAETRFLKIFNTGFVTVDNGSSAVAGLFISGSTSPPAAGGTLGDMAIGYNTGGRMEINDGGAVAVHRGFIGQNSGSNGAVTVSDPGSRWDCTGSIWSGNSGTGSLQVLNGGVVTSAGNGYLGFATNSAGYASVSGAGSSWTTADTVYVGGNGAAPGGSGTLLIEGGGTVAATETKIYNTGFLELGANPILNGLLTVLGGKIEAVSNTTFAKDFTLGTEGVFVYTAGSNATFSGNISGSGGLTKSGGFSLGPGTLTLTGSNTYTGPTAIFNGKLAVDGSITSAVTVNSGATVGGSGVVGSVTINSGGIVAPGTSPGKLTINGNYNQTSAGTLVIELGGSAPGTGFDQLAVSGQAAVGGTLNVSLVNGFRPAVGDAFAILTSSSETGNFSTINSSGFTVRSDASPTGIVLTVLSVEPLFIVTTTDDHNDGVCNAADCTLREAINAANSSASSSIGFASGVTGTIQLASALPPLSRTIALQGPGANLLTVRRNIGGAYRIFTINPGAVVSFSGLTMANGDASGATPPNLGGAIFNDHAVVSLTSCVVTGNTAFLGGGIFSRGSSSGAASLTINNSTLSANSASGSIADGGGIYNEGVDTGTALLSLTNCTLSGNTASLSGAAIANYGRSGNARTTLTNCTFNGNTIYNDQATLLLANTLLAASAGANLVNSSGTITSQGHNLSSDAAGGNGGSTGPGGFLNGSGDIRNTNPQLAMLANNGGPTQTHALLLNSPAINAGNDANSPPTDQRGYLRNGISDIGAFEFGGIELRIVGIARNGADIVVTFQAVAGKTFHLERKLALTDPSWQSIAGVRDITPAATGPVPITDPGATSLGKAFYRVRLLP